MKTLVGIRPTGQLHIGHYFSVIKPALETGADVLIARYHAPENDYTNMMMEVALYGVTVKLQELNTDLYFRLLSFARDGELRRMTQFKSKEKTAAMYAYPVLMAHDVVGYDKVIVGEDQKQHLEYAKVLLKRAGLPYPQGDYRGGRVMDLLDPTKKMSKSEPRGCLFLGEDPLPKLRKAVTTPTGIKNLAYIAKQLGVGYDPKNNLQSKELLAEAIKKIEGK